MVLAISVVFMTACAVEHWSFVVVTTVSSCDIECLALVVTDSGKSSPGSKMILVVMGSMVCSFTQARLISPMTSSTGLHENFSLEVVA